MELTFLASSDGPLSKSFTRDAATGALTSTSYPRAWAFTSTTVTVATLPDLAKALTAAGNAGMCLLKGNPSRALHDESRAGSTDPNAPTCLLVFDLDGAPFSSPDDFMAAIGLGYLSYVLQWSASAGIDPTKSGLRAHIFCLLDTPTVPAKLKLYLQNLNLATPILRAAMTLTKTLNSPTWPVDVSVCQNDKLIYIAPPVLTNITDPYAGVRIAYIQKQAETFTLPPAVPSALTLRPLIDARVNELRVAANVPKRRASLYKIKAGVEYLHKPDDAYVSGIKEERGFVYLNLNDGDSWAYYHPVDNAEFIFNFKSEPNYRTEELLPDYYRSLQQTAAVDSQKIYLAFRDFNTSSYYTGYYDEAVDELDLKRTNSRAQVMDFAKRYGLELNDAVPDMRMEFMPHEPARINFKTGVVNTFSPSKIMLMDYVQVNEPPRTCQELITNVLGDTPEIVEHFHNWMAYICQRLELTYTGWVWHGVQGTGKGLLVNRVLLPIFENLMTVKRMEQLEENFTADMENRFIVFVDEIQTSSARKGGMLMAKIKNIMVEPNISSRAMYSESRRVRNYSNFIFASNMHDPVDVPSDDRRFNVGDYQTKRLPVPSQQWLDTLDAEVPDLYRYWMTLVVDETRARTALHTRARQDLIDTSTQAADEVSQALMRGNLEWFVEQLPTNAPVVSNNTFTVNARDALTLAYRDLIRSFVIDGVTKISRDDLHTLFRYLVGENIPVAPNKFTKYLGHHKLRLKAIWSSSQNKKVTGIEIEPSWNLSDPNQSGWLAQAQKDLK